MSISVVAFDAYGTLFDVYSVSARLESLYPGHGSSIAGVWRDKQIEYTRLISLSDPAGHDGSRFYQSFWELTRLALRYALAKHAFLLTADTEQSLMVQYGKLEAFAENQGVLKALKDGGLKTCILSNGSPEMLGQAVAHAGFKPWLDHILSVDRLRQYKTLPVTYEMVTHTFAVPVADVLFVSGNGWDIMGAHWFGFQTCWINRQGLPEETLGPRPHYQGSDLRVVQQVLGC